MMHASSNPDPANAGRCGAEALRAEVLAMRRVIAQGAQLERIELEAVSSPSAVRRPMPVPNPASAAPILHSHVDAFELRDGLFHLQGWAVVPDWDPRTTTAWLFVEGNPSWLTMLARERRPDVAAALAAHPGIADQPAVKHLAECGFHALIDPNGIDWLEEGTHAWICLMNDARCAAVRVNSPGSEPAQS
jgi:hypothetical protein